MGRKFNLVAWLTTCLAGLGSCDGPRGFIFPPNSTLTNPTPTNITVHANDSIVVEYIQGVAGGIILLGQHCSASSGGVSAQSASTPIYTSSTYNDTGTLLWNVGNATNGISPGVNGSLACSLTLMNFSISECSWGPFGLLSFNQDLLHTWSVGSAMFTILPQNSTKPKTITNPATSSRTQAPITATQSGKAVCPPSGIPPGPLFVPPVTQIAMYPQMVPGLEFLT